MDTTRDDIIHQLTAFGWTKQQCIAASQKTHNPNDINDMLQTLQDMQYNASNNFVTDNKPSTSFASHNNLMVFGYLHAMYEEKYDQLIPTDIKMLCCNYCGYGLCCIIFTQSQPETNICEGDLKVDSLQEFYKSHKLNYTHKTQNNQNINTLEALFTSIIAKHMTCFNYLISKTKSATLNGSPPVVVAARAGNIQCIQQLSDTNPIVIDEPSNKTGRTSLWLASFFGYYEIVKLLIETSKVNVNHGDHKGFTPLFVAAQCDHANVVLLLLQHNAKANQSEARGHTPLWIASLRGHSSVIEALFSCSNIKIDTQDIAGVSALWAACQNNHTLVAELLLNPSNKNIKAADPNLPNSDGCTPLWIAASRGSIDCIEILIKYGATINIRDTSPEQNSGATPLFVASQNGKKNVVEILLGANANPNMERTSDGATPIMVASCNGHIEVVKILLANGADVLKVNKIELNVLGCASMNGHTDIIGVLYKYLLTMQDEMKITEFFNACDGVNGWTSLHLACMGGHENTAKYLVETIKVDICKRDYEQQLASFYAWQYGYSSIVSWLSPLEAAFH